jgi:hypothetical protein
VAIPELDRSPWEMTQRVCGQSAQVPYLNVLPWACYATSARVVGTAVDVILEDKSPMGEGDLEVAIGWPQHRPCGAGQ